MARPILIATISLMACVANAAEELETPQWPENPPDNWMTYHLLHPGPGFAWAGDPNAAFYYKGRYHLHYIYDVPSLGRYKNLVFAHVSSKDMVHWRWHPTVLSSLTMGHGMCSGTGFFTKEGKAAMVYCGQGSKRNWIAYPLDDNMDKWSKPEVMLPKDKNGKPVTNMPYFDPDIWINNGVYYGINGRDSDTSAVLMKSDDLKNWEYLGELLHEDFDEERLGVSRHEDVSCANMFKIGNKWMLLCISHDLGCRYFLGDFKDDKYLPDFHGLMNFSVKGEDDHHFFAPESLLTPDGRRVTWSWIIGVALPPRTGLPSGVQSLPRELELPEDGVLRIRPLRELKKLRYDEQHQEQFTVRKDDTYILKQIAGDDIELKFQFKSSPFKGYGIDMFCDENGENGLRFTVSPESKTLGIGTVKNVPFELKPGEDLTLRIFIDKNLVEVFANDRQAVAYPHIRTHSKANIRLFSNGSDLKVKKVTAWKMKSIYQGDAVFEGNRE